MGLQWSPSEQRWSNGGGDDFQSSGNWSSSRWNHPGVIKPSDPTTHTWALGEKSASVPRPFTWAYLHP